MKIQYALMSCSASPRYTEYWPMVARAWLKLGITPVCLFIPDNQTHKLPEAPGGIVHTIPPLKDAHIVIQSQMLRFWGSYLYPNATVIISDIDLIPLSKDFFYAQLAPYPEHAYLHLQGNTTDYPYANVFNIPERITRINNMRYLVPWFQVAKGEIMSRVLKLNPDWATSCRKAIPYYLHKDATIKIVGHVSNEGSRPFYGDEIYASIRLHHAKHRPIFYSPFPNRYSIMTSETIFIRHVEKNLSCIHFSPLRYAEYKKTIDLFLTERKLPKPQTPWDWYMDYLAYLTRKIKIAGPWLALILLTLSMVAARILYRRRQGELLKLLWLKRQLLLITKYPPMTWFQK